MSSEWIGCLFAGVLVWVILYGIAQALIYPPGYDYSNVEVDVTLAVVVLPVAVAIVLLLC